MIRFQRCVWMAADQAGSWFGIAFGVGPNPAISVWLGRATYTIQWMREP